MIKHQRIRTNPSIAKYFLALFILGLSCTTLPEDPTTTKRAELFFRTPRLSPEYPEGGLTLESPLLQEYQTHFRFSQYIPEDLDYQHFLGKLQWKKGEYAGINFFQISEAQGHIILFHGFLGSQALWRNTLGRFIQLGYNIVMVDLPGHGFATGVRGAIDDFDDYGTLITATLDWYQARVPSADALILGGHSTGGTGIIQYLKDPQHPIEAVFLVNPLLHHVFWDVGQIAAFLTQGLLPYHKPLFEPDSYLGPAYFPATWPVRLGEWNSRLPETISTEVPILIHQGNEDDVVDFEYNLSRLATLLPRAQVIRRDKLGHTSLLSDEWSQIILDDVQAFLEVSRLP